IDALVCMDEFKQLFNCPFTFCGDTSTPTLLKRIGKFTGRLLNNFLNLFDESSIHTLYSHGGLVGYNSRSRIDKNICSVRLDEKIGKESVAIGTIVFPVDSSDAINLEISKQAGPRNDMMACLLTEMLRQIQKSDWYKDAKSHQFRFA
ncbi:MAG: hypothetical protein RIQ56_277, partial [Candidatus Parcubacteria bacterium]